MSTPASDLYQQNAGVQAVNIGPIIIRTYNDLSGNNTYLLGKYDIPISSNYVLITSTGGKLVPSNAIYVSSIATSTLNAVSSNISTLNVSTLNAVSSNISALNTSTLTSGFINYSTLIGSTISTNSLVVTDLIASSISVSSLVLNTFLSLTGSTITSNTQTVNSTFLVSTIISGNINYSTLTGSTITSGNINYSTLTGSTITSNTVLIQSITTSTLNTSGIVSIAATQSNLDYPNYPKNWTAISSQLTSTGYNGCAMSASGQYQAVINSSGGIYYTSNYGQSWVQTLSSVVFNYVAMSSSGEYVLAYSNVSLVVANMYVLSNYGQSSSYVSTNNRLSAAIAISASGQYMAVASYGNTLLSVSNNYGQSWYASYSGITSSSSYTAITLSASGQYMIVGHRAVSGTQQSKIYTSNNYGQSWSLIMGRNYSYIHDITNSASGQYACFTYGDEVYYSNNYGYSWTISSNITNVYFLCMSESGQFVIAGNGTNIYYSTNYGQYWTLSSYISSDNSYTGFAISANGQYVLALSNTGANTVLYNIPLVAFSLSILTSNINHGIIIGQTASIYNSFQILYNHVGVGNVANYMSICSYTNPNGFNITANGYVGIGITTPLSLLHVNGTITSGTILPLSDNLYNIGGLTLNRFAAVYAVNGTIQTSDSSEKVLNILPYGLNELMQIRTIMYKWKSQALLPDTELEKNFQYYGVCADQLSNIFPELVYNEDPSVPMQLNYSELIPVLIKAVQEQTQKINSLELQLASIKNQMERIHS